MSRGALAALCLAGAVSPSGAGRPQAPRAGIDVFRKSGHDGLSCAQCHSPDGIEIAAFGFGRKDIERRADNHVDPADGERIAAFILGNPAARHALRGDVARPLQPGGSVLPGKTAIDRDARFGDELGHLVPELCGPPIRSLALARRAKDRLLKLDPRTVRVGIPFNLLSEDGYHGTSHATVADWIPDVSVGLTPALFEIEDSYLADPSDANLAALEKAVAAIRPTSAFHQLSIDKFRSLLLLQHAIRLGGARAARLDRVRLIGPGNPFWDVAEVAHHNAGGDPQFLAVPADVLAKKRALPLALQMRQMRLPWYWTGWALDPTLARIERGLSRTGVRADYFTHFLWVDGPYPIHMAFMLSLKLVDSGFAPWAAAKGLPQHYEIQFSNFVLGDALLKTDTRWAPIRPEVFKISANAFRLALYLLESDVETTGACVRPESQRTQIRAMRAFFAAGGGDSTDTELCDRVERELLAAHVDYR